MFRQNNHTYHDFPDDVYEGEHPHYIPQQKTQKKKGVSTMLRNLFYLLGSAVLGMILVQLL